MHLSEETFKTVIDSTPLISIDLIIQDNNARFLLGKRVNRPAQGDWFVPGGRVLKNEALDEAFTRLSNVELGQAFERKDALFLGVYEHFYDNSAPSENISTHYIVLGYKLVLTQPLTCLPELQHNNYRWQTADEILSSDDVHIHTKWYFGV